VHLGTATHGIGGSADRGMESAAADAGRVHLRAGRRVAPAPPRARRVQHRAGRRVRRGMARARAPHLRGVQRGDEGRAPAAAARAAGVQRGAGLGLWAAAAAGASSPGVKGPGISCPNCAYRADVCASSLTARRARPTLRWASAFRGSCCRRCPAQSTIMLACVSAVHTEQSAWACGLQQVLYMSSYCDRQGFFGDTAAGTHSQQSFATSELHPRVCVAWSLLPWVCCGRPGVSGWVADRPSVVLSERQARLCLAQVRCESYRGPGL